MARQRFGGGAADWVFTAGTGGAVDQAPGAVITLWDSLAGGNQYGPAPMPGGVDDGTGLLDTTLIPVTTVTCDANGEIPDSFLGPDGVFKMAADASGGSGPRRWLLANSVGDALSALSSQQQINVTQLAFLGSTAPVFVYWNNSIPGYPARPDTGAPVFWVGPAAPAFGPDPVTGIQYAIDGIDFFLGPAT